MNRIIQKGKDLVIECDHGANVLINNLDHEGKQMTAIEIVIPDVERNQGYKLFDITNKGVDNAELLLDGKGALLIVSKDI